ncbi:probable E3 ubiquitin-protein ligase RHG1A [Vicia villosa]|uniref:probable E3 ubiquitin-protein ligase RHG1A n=1 Tax=Vicia villosa TaxID=3911 RepID=UPI00273CACAB|nr:probable E3 ubiquitin-protein ligase RHG1A [Vicia villosa]
MDGKRANDGVIVPRKGIGSSMLKDTVNTRNGQVCSRLGCSSKVGSSKSSQIGSSEKGKSLRPSFRFSSNGKETIGSSSRTSSGSSNPGKPNRKPQKTLASHIEIDSSETSSVQDEPEVSKPSPPPEKSKRGLQAEDETRVQEVGSSSVASNTRSRRNFHPKPGLRSQEVQSTGPGTRAGTSRHGLRNLKCNSVSDVVPAGSAPSDSNLNRRNDSIKKRNCEGESSSTARGKKINGPSGEGRNSVSRNGISISDSRISRNAPHRDRPDNNTVSVRTRRSIGGHARGRLSGQGNANPVVPNQQSLIMVPSFSHSGNRNALGVQDRSSLETPSSPSSYSGAGTSSDELYGVITPTEYGLTRPLMNRDSFRRRYNMDGIAEVLLALERIEQDVELTHEQILLLESNLFLTGLNFYDQHRDMRLDIDNMSYEELLALEDRMGTVSTAVTEEALSECLKRSSYQYSDSASKEDIKCSICQEEYASEEEVGSLKCEHKYHMACIQQWLRLKNWCPICKASVASSSSPPSH